MSNHAHPARILYGSYYLHESFCLFWEPDARARAAEYDLISGSATRREAVENGAKVQHISNPFEDHDWEDDELDEPLSRDEIPGAADGDWPPMPTSNALDDFPETEHPWMADVWELEGVEVVTTTLNGDYLLIPNDEKTEKQLQAIWDRHGVAYVRDDAVVSSFEI